MAINDGARRLIHSSTSSATYSGASYPSVSIRASYTRLPKGTDKTLATIDRWIEVDAATGQRRLHTPQSLEARLRVLGKDPSKPPTDGTRSWFRRAKESELSLPPATLNGFGGTIAAPQVCPVCHGAGFVRYRDELSTDNTACWKCRGRGTVAP